MALVQEPQHYVERHVDRRAFVGMRRRTTAATFRAAKQHSRRVRALRIGLPVAAAAAAVISILVAWLDPSRLLKELPFGLSDVVISGTKIKMDEPRMSGFTRDARHYELTARSAAQDIAKPNLVELSALTAKMHMQDKSIVQISANNGLFDTKAEMLKLESDIVVKSSTGYEGHLREAVVNTRTGSIVSDQPVALKMLHTTINANGMEIEQAGDLIRFTGGVAMQLIPSRDMVRGATPAADAAP